MTRGQNAAGGHTRQLARRCCLMSESKFSGTLRRLKKTPEGAPDPKPAISPSVGQRPLIGHYRGKRSDPEWANITILMRRSIKKDVRRRLEDAGEGRVISELTDQLLIDWLGNPADREGAVRV